MASRKQEEGAVAASWGNQAAAGILRRARESTGQRQKEFAPELYEAMEAPFASAETLGSWERAQRQVPAAAVIAAAMLAEKPIDELLSPVDGRERFNRWVRDTIPGLLRKITALEGQLVELRAHVFPDSAEGSRVDELEELVLSIARHTGYAVPEAGEAASAD